MLKEGAVVGSNEQNATPETGAPQMIREHRIGHHYVDGYCPETRTVYEFYGKPIVVHRSISRTFHCFVCRRLLLSWPRHTHQPHCRQRTAAGEHG